ncbi:hypothetical protein FAF44_20475 [Nonomuraea sp. MG754425]|uniref:aminoglycoside 6-adenylyltransferase n=1 Tax=Nonomuraea sp. MG754425 TaxID=2570319 RepID=UPI001F3E4466|nr:aminoglycoside 6-adenylyltransferase [Nonomuraea sp. MG754425]MCF6470749.1 hypothetical protein [Nonomuraea sp. MG754425]
MTDPFGTFLAQARQDPRVLGVVLSGSRAREGAATARSDHDVYVIVTDRSAIAPRRDAVLDVVVMTLEEFRGHALPGSGTEWNRYAFAYAKVLKDASAGIGDLVAAKGRLAAEESEAVAVAALGAFLNSAYRCLKNDRDANSLAARLDGAEAASHYLTYVFALHGRVRPYHKYVEWELRRHPLRLPIWGPEELLPRLEAALSPQAAQAVRGLLNDVEPPARAAGHGEVFDGWGADLAFMRGR